MDDKPAYLDAITVICFSINLEISMRMMTLFLHLSSCTTWFLSVIFQESCSQEHSPIQSNSHVLISMAESTFQEPQLVAVVSHPREVMWWGNGRLSHLRQLAMMTQHTGTGTVGCMMEQERPWLASWGCTELLGGIPLVPMEQMNKHCILFGGGGSMRIRASEGLGMRKWLTHQSQEDQLRLVQSGKDETWRESRAISVDNKHCWLLTGRGRQSGRKWLSELGKAVGRNSMAMMALGVLSLVIFLMPSPSLHLHFCQTFEISKLGDEGNEFTFR